MAGAICRLLGAAGLVALLSGCVDFPIGSPQPSFEVVQAASASGMPASAVGTFGPGPGLSADSDRSLGVRADTLVPPPGQSFSQYLGELLKADLAAAGKLDANAATTISGQLDRNELHAGSLDVNDAGITATFTVTRAGGVVFKKQFDASAHWDSSFLGAIAIPNAINQYTSLYKGLLQQLFADAEFRSAIQNGAKL